MPGHIFRFEDDKNLLPQQPVSPDQLLELAPMAVEPTRTAIKPRPRMDTADLPTDKTMGMLPTLSVTNWDVDPSKYGPKTIP